MAEFSFLGRSTEGLLMGDAYTAIADDANTLFYNPAALARHNGVTITPINPSFTIPDVVEKDFSFDGASIGLSKRFQNFPKEPDQVAERILGIPLYLQLGITPVIKMEHFAMNFFANSKTNMQLENFYHPTLQLDYRLDRGMMFGYAFVLNGNKKGKPTSGGLTSIGVGVKSVNRQGLKGRFDLTGTQLLQIIENSDNYKAIREGLGYSKGSGWGFDLGAEQSFYSGVSRTTFGASLLDIGNTKFSKEEGIKDVPDQLMSLNFGSAFEQDFGLFSYALALDYHNAIDGQSSTASKIHFGMRGKFPIANVYWGWNAGYLSYGVALDLFMFKFQLGFYGVELGPRYKQKEGERAVFSINLLNVSLDSF